MAMTIKKMDNPTVTVPRILGDTAIRVDISILQNKCKEAKSKDIHFEEDKKKIYSLILQHSTPTLESKLKGMDKNDAIKTEQNRIVLAKLI